MWRTNEIVEGGHLVVFGKNPFGSEGVKARRTLTVG
jgi:hypothetical protein